MSLKEVLEKYSKSNMYPFHMPGHKRMLEGCYKIDMTEVEGVDDLHDPETVIKEEQERLARLYKAGESFILVGGSTVGNLSAIYASCNEGDTIIIQRNSHKSVYNAAMLRHLKVEYIEPDLDENGIFKAVTIEQIQVVVEKIKQVKAIVLTSPTYEGYHCKLEEINSFCHENNIILVVDQAHGAHLGFNENLEGSAVEYADITVQSLHKTLPCLTQTAVLHVKGNRVDRKRIREALDIFETSSPSYVLMNSVSECLDFLENSEDSFRDYVDNSKDFYHSCGELKHLRVVEEAVEIKDLGKIVITTKNTNMSGITLSKILREKYQLETELSSFCYVLAMTSVMDSREGFDRLKTALLEIDDSLEEGCIELPRFNIKNKKLMESFEAKAGDEKLVDLKEATNKISAAMVCLYPPGAPIIVPGEEISPEVVEIIDKARKEKIHVTGLERDSISVVN